MFYQKACLSLSLKLFDVHVCLHLILKYFYLFIPSSSLNKKTMLLSY